MIRYTNEQLASVIALPIVTILLVWTAAIFQRNRKNWGAYDIPIVAILVLSIVRNMTILAYTLFVTLNQNTIDIDYCSSIIWIFNSIHTFQASNLTTLAVIGLFSVKLHRKQQRLRHFLTSTHVIYHLFCLTTLCACVGVAAILAQNDGANFKNVTIFETNPCKFMPFDLDIKFNVFIIVLNVFLATVSLVAFLAICFNHYKIKKAGFDYLKNKSNSDLSELSLGLANGYGNDNKNYYDTYTIQRQTTDGGGGGATGGGYYEGQNCVVWNSDVSNISTTVSSTNSRRPCIAQQGKKSDENRTGLETIHPVLIVCYLFYHLPLMVEELGNAIWLGKWYTWNKENKRLLLIAAPHFMKSFEITFLQRAVDYSTGLAVLSVYPNLVAPWPVAGVALWLGLVQDLLIPIGLSIVDSRFSKWVCNVYRCSDKNGSEKLPHVGLDGKFRPFTSQPQSLEVVQNQQQVRALQTVEHRFPITNGSLYTSIDGRLPVIHNYRRHKDHRVAGLKQPEVQTVAGHLRRPPFIDVHDPYNCRSCEVDLCPSHSNLHHLSPHYINKQLNLIQQIKDPLQKNLSLSEESLRRPPDPSRFHHLDVLKNSRNLVRLNRMRLCKSEDSLNEIDRDLKQFKANPELFQRSRKRSANEQILDYSSSDDDSNNGRNHHQNFDDTTSSQSSFSITTEANGDFDFYQNNELRLPEKQSVVRDSFRTDFRITRANSKRSLENFQTFVEEGGKVQRSNSYMTLEDRKRKRNSKKLLRSDSKLSDCTHNIRQKIKSVEYLPSSNASTVFIEDVFYFNYPDQKGGRGEFKSHVGSAPDLKKVFISEYI